MSISSKMNLNFITYIPKEGGHPGKPTPFPEYPLCKTATARSNPKSLKKHIFQKTVFQKRVFFWAVPYFTMMLTFENNFLSPVL